MITGFVFYIPVGYFLWKKMAICVKFQIDDYYRQRFLSVQVRGSTLFKHKNSLFSNFLRREKRAEPEDSRSPYSVKFEGFYQKTEVKSYDSEEDGEEAIRIYLHEKSLNNILLTNFYENDRVVEISDPDGNDWYCCTRLWVH